MNDNDIQSKILCARIDDLCRRCETRYCPCFTSFLSPHERAVVLREAAKHPDVLCVEFTGVDTAERAVLGFFPKDLYLFEKIEDLSEDDRDEYEREADIGYVKVTGSGYRKIGHKDVLGALMALGLKRETLGDILISDDAREAYIVALGSVVPYICDNLVGVSSDKVKAVKISRHDMPRKTNRFADMSLTVASQRLDALIASALGMSREKSKKFITSGLVSVNYTVCMSADSGFNPGDVISVKGGGKFLVDSLLGQTQKNRFRVIVRKYL